MNKTIFIVSMLFLFVFGSIISWMANSNHKVVQIDHEVKVDKEKTSFIDFEVKGDKVFIKCYVTLKNQDTKDVKVSLTAMMPEDVKIGLLKKAKLPGVNKKNEESFFLIPGKTQSTFEVNFIGEFGGENRKTNRNAPNVNVEKMN